LWNRDGSVAWVADVPDSRDKYLAFFNAGDPPQRGRRGRRGAERAGRSSAPTESRVIRATFAELGLASPCRVHNLWAKADLGEFEDGFASEIRPHGAGLYRVSPR